MTQTDEPRAGIANNEGAGFILDRLVDADSVGVVVRLAKVLEIVLGDTGLTMNQFRLMQLASQGSPSTAELSLRLVMKAPNVSALTGGLIDRGLVRQKRRRGDGRRRDISLTAEGTRLLTSATELCGEALRVLAASDTSAVDLLGSLGLWLPALDREADRLREVADTGSADPYGLTSRQHGNVT